MSNFVSHKFLVQPFQQARQIPVAQRVAQRKGPRRFVAGTNGGHVGEFNFLPVAGEDGEFFNFTFKLPRVRADAADEFGKRLLGNVLFALADGRSRRDFRAFHPVPVIRRERREIFHRADFVERLVKGFPLVHLARADKQPDILPGERFQFLRQFRQRFCDRCRRSRAFVAEKIAVAQPDDFAAEPKNGSVWRASRSLAMTFSASPLLETVASMVS